MPKDLTFGLKDKSAAIRPPLPQHRAAEIARFATDGLLSCHQSMLSARGKGNVGKSENSGNSQTDEANSPSSAVAILRGPFRLIRSDGRDVTPESPLRQAMLAVLVTAPRQIKSRKTLQDLFWTDFDAERASGNLRTAIYLLRRDLQTLGNDVLRADRQTVSLLPGAIRAETGIAFGNNILDGLDLGLSSCEAFEDWLRDIRLADDAVPVIPSSARITDGAVTSGVGIVRAKSHVALGLLPAVHNISGQSDRLKVIGFTDAIVSFIRQTTLLDVHDLRGLEGPIAPLPLETGRGATHWLQAVAEESAKKLTIRLRLLEGASRKLLWLSEPVSGQCLPDDDLACAIGEVVLNRLHDTLQDSWQPNLFPLTAISALFSLDTRIVAEADAQLRQLQERGGPPYLECLRFFAQVFNANEGLGRYEAMDADEVCEALARIATTDPMLPLCQSIVGYSMHMLFARNELASHLIESARVSAPNLALNLDHLAVIRLMNGDLKGAEEASRQCLRAGHQSPWRYTYELTGAMVSLAKGDYRQSLYYANQSLFRQPRYLAALRYAMTSLALSGQIDDARLMHRRILRLRPDFALSGWAENVLRRTPTELGSAIIGGLRAASIL